jgi:ribosome-associated toxin RatA of RatAB toxin-antitoxin module
MQTSISRLVHADAAVVFELAARVEDWPRILPHYRWVRLVDQTADHRTVDMAARRDVLPVVRLGIPLRWTARQRLDPATPRIEFEHVGGVTRGMRVAWTFEPRPDGQLQVAIWHEFNPRWPAPPIRVDLIVGEYFVNGVARRTLKRICDLAEARTRSA